MSKSRRGDNREKKVDGGALPWPSLFFTSMVGKVGWCMVPPLSPGNSATCEDDTLSLPGVSGSVIIGGHAYRTYTYGSS